MTAAVVLITPPRRAARMTLCWLMLSTAVWAESDTDWPSFRGPRASGLSAHGPTPVQWDLETGTNVIWSSRIEGLAHSSPVVSGAKVCVSTAVRLAGDPSLKVGLYGDIQPVADEGAHRWMVSCLDRQTGAILWEQVLHEGAPRIKRHTKSTHANSTPATDGAHLVAFFGSEGLYGLDLDGNLLWQRDLGVLDSGFFVAPEAQWGFGSSPIIHDGRVIVQVDVQGEDYLAAFDVRTGEELWRTVRDEVPTWSTPTIYEVEGQVRIAVNGWQHAGGYDLATGEEIWRLTGGGDIPVPTPVVAHDLIFLTSSHGSKNPILAIRTNAQGDISLRGDSTSGEYIAWAKWRDGAYMPTPVVYEGRLYVLRDNGTLFCYDARTGQEHYKVRVGKGGTGFSASPIAAAGRIYLTSEMGDVFVVASGTDFELLATNSTGGVTMATPAISGSAIYFRTRDSLIAVGEVDPVLDSASQQNAGE